MTDSTKHFYWETRLLSSALLALEGEIALLFVDLPLNPNILIYWEILYQPLAIILQRHRSLDVVDLT